MSDDLLAEALRTAGTHERTTQPTMEPDPNHPGQARQTAYCQWCATHRPDEDPRWPCETARLLAAIAAEYGTPASQETALREALERIAETCDHTIHFDLCAGCIARAAIKETS